MAEILTESFCERCGTRYTFESPGRRANPLGVIGTVGRGIRNFVAMPDASLDEAFAVARAETEQGATAHQLEAFHQTFNFCLSCRQYTCGECWNAVEGRCLSCAPLPEAEVRADPILAAEAFTIAASGADAPPYAPGPADLAWPAIEVDLPDAELRLPPIVVPQPEPEIEGPAPEAPTAVGAAEAPAPEALAVEPTAVVEEAVIAPDLEVAPEVTESEPEAIQAAEPEPVTATPVDREPAVVADAAEPEINDAVEAAVAMEAAEPELHVEAPQPAQPAAEPEPAPLAADEVARPRYTNGAPLPSPAKPPSTIPGLTPGVNLDAEIAAYEERVAALAVPDVAPPTRPMPLAAIAMERATASGIPEMPPEVPGAPAHISTVGTCPSCGLSLSASARFCRRCGTQQHI